MSAGLIITLIGCVVVGGILVIKSKKAKNEKAK